MNTKQSILTLIFSFIFGIIGGYFSVQYSGNINVGKISNNNYIQSLEKNIVSLVKKTSPSVVSIIIKKDLAIYKSDPWGFFQYKVGSVEKKVGGGSGFFVSKTGIIITNTHVVSDKNAHYTIILNNGNEFEATLIASKKDTDIAFLQIHSSKKDFPALVITAKNTHIELGQFSVAIGNALSQFDNSVSFGIISGINRNIQDNYMNLQGLIQTDTAINPGNSGGPLIGLNGKVLGINTLILHGSNNIGFAIPINQNEINEYIKKISIAYSQ